MHIGMTAYNSEKTLNEAWSSVESQDHQDWRMTLIDAGSSDGTWVQCQEIARADGRVRAVRMAEQTAWILNARHHLLSAEQPYFMLADADDRWSPNWITENLRVLETQRLAASFGRIGVMSNDSCPTPHVAAGRTISGLDSRSRLVRQIRFAAKPEVLGKANLIYSVWRTAALRQVFPWDLDSLQGNRDLKFLVRALNSASIGSASEATIYRRQGPSVGSNASSEALLPGWMRAAMVLGAQVPSTYPREFAENVCGPATRMAVYGTVGARSLISGAVRTFGRAVRLG